MNGRDEIALLLGQIEKSQAVLARIAERHDEFLQTDFKLLGRKNTSAMVIAELLVDYYTCLETLFLRVSQFFENNLRQEKWHADLLEKMTVRIEGVREPVISDETRVLLGELMKFRHFRRYYFELDYDWDKLDYLERKFAEVQARIEGELNSFKSFLRALRTEVGE
jgi:hypothetical protein